MAAKADIRTNRTQRALLIAALIGGALLLALVAGLAAGNNRLLIASLFLLAPGGVFGALFVARRFDLAVLLIPPLALLLPTLEAPTGTETKLPAVWVLAGGLLGFWFLTMLLRGRWRFAPTALNRPMLAFAIVCTISLIWGIVWRDPVLIDAPRFILVQITSLLTVLFSIGAALLIGNFVQSERRLKLIVVLFIVCGGLMAFTQYRDMHQTLLNDRGLWGTWAGVAAFGVLIAQPRLRWHWRAALLAVLGLILYVSIIVNGDWVSGWVPLLAAMLTATLLRSWKLFLVVLVITAIIGYTQLGFFTKVADDNINDGSLERLTLWEQNWRVVRAHWLFGTGPAGYALYYMTYYRDDARSTHNNYLDILAQFGFLGMAAWLWLTGTAAAIGWRLAHRAPPGFLRTLAIIATAGWVGANVSMFFGDWMLPFAYNQGNGGFKYTVYSWIFLGTLISLQQILRNDTAAAEVTHP
jgi:hypothetical protein